MKLKALAASASALALGVCLLGAAGCSGSSDAKDFQGVWSVEGSNPTVTVVFTGDQWKLATGITYEYSLDTKGKVISYSVDGMSGSSTYEFSEDKQTLTLTEDAGNGETKSTVFDKVSADTQAEPTVGGE
ncbi:MAG: hypothetical protein ACI36W_05800 [Coriobacteriales bacterium]